MAVEAILSEDLINWILAGLGLRNIEELVWVAQNDPYYDAFEGMEGGKPSGFYDKFRKGQL